MINFVIVLFFYLFGLYRYFWAVPLPQHYYQDLSLRPPACPRLARHIRIRFEKLNNAYKQRGKVWWRYLLSTCYSFGQNLYNLVKS